MQKVPDFVNYQGTSLYEEFMSDLHQPCGLPGAKNGHLILQYGTTEYSIIADILDVLKNKDLLLQDPASLNGRLEQLHEIVAAEHRVLDGTQQSHIARSLYETNTTVLSFFEQLLRSVIAPALDLGPLYYQTTPTFRVFFPRAEGYPGRTTYHCDFMLGHTPREVNVFIPLTQCEGTRSLLLGGLAGSLELLDRYDGDYARFAHDTQFNEDVIKECEALCQPVELEVGDILLFDPRCIHAGPNNMTEQTRVTVDIRVLPQSRFETQKNSYVGTGRRKMPFVPGVYFSQHAI